MARLALTAVLVRDYDEAIDWYVRVLGFRLATDEDQGGGKRWVVIEDESGRGLLLARAKKPEELAAIGNQHGGRVGFFLQVDDFDNAHARLTTAGARFDEPPRNEIYGNVVVFRDLYGNRWDLCEPAANAAESGFGRGVVM
jgi:catechol 2,3-dioxygenase-like lactoylglutathione lyase family enzyme